VARETPLNYLMTLSEPRGQDKDIKQIKQEQNDQCYSNKFEENPDEVCGSLPPTHLDKSDTSVLESCERLIHLPLCDRDQPHASEKENRLSIGKPLCICEERKPKHDRTKGKHALNHVSILSPFRKSPKLNLFSHH